MITKKLQKQWKKKKTWFLVCGHIITLSRHDKQKFHFSTGRIIPPIKIDNRRPIERFRFRFNQWTQCHCLFVYEYRRIRVGSWWILQLFWWFFFAVIVFPALVVCLSDHSEQRKVLIAVNFEERRWEKRGKEDVQHLSHWARLLLRCLSLFFAFILVITDQDDPLTYLIRANVIG